MRNYYIFSCKSSDVTEHDKSQVFVDVPSSRFFLRGVGTATRRLIAHLPVHPKNLDSSRLRNHVIGDHRNPKYHRNPRIGLRSPIVERNKYSKYIKFYAEQGWHSGESTRLPPMWPGFDSRTRRHMWVEFVAGSRHRFFSGYSGFTLSSNTNTSKFQFEIRDSRF